jgi:hypothetical protein
MRSALEIYRALPAGQGDAFAVEAHPLHQELLVAKDSSGAPAVICASTAPTTAAIPVRLRNVLLLPQAQVEVRRGDDHHLIEAAVYRCRAASTPLREYFIVSVASIVSSLLTAGQFDAGSVLQQLAELFHRLETPARSTVQGLWGELFIVAESTRPAILLDAWHSDPYEQFDFAQGSERLEVKTSASADRRHHFSLSQARPASSIRAVIASIICTRSTGGVSLEDLAQRVRGLAKNPLQAIKVEMLLAEAVGDALVESLDTRFDRELARASLRFYPTDRVPSVSADLPEGVSNVHFEVQLREVSAMSHSDMPNYGSLLEAAWPRERG